MEGEIGKLLSLPQTSAFIFLFSLTTLYSQQRVHSGDENIPASQSWLRGVRVNAADADGRPALGAGNEPRDKPLQAQPDLHLVSSIRLQPGEASFYVWVSSGGEQ